ncbi:MAG TPA: AAA family ATPase [Terracidiphilus sp.]|nr:AAA family ATPase [Terracidiphilus sp.]
MKEIVILAGPNGAGKTTAARKLIPKFPYIQEFLNADEFARAISPSDPEAAAFSAGRRMLERMRELVERNLSFGLETTLSGKAYLHLLKRCKGAGWRITLLYLWLPSPSAAIRRVAQRVREGGHGLPPEVIRRRYFAGLSNFLRLYLPLADELEVYDNSVRRVQIAKRSEGGVLVILDSERWSKLKRASRCKE